MGRVVLVAWIASAIIQGNGRVEEEGVIDQGLFWDGALRGVDTKKPRFSVVFWLIFRLGNMVPGKGLEPSRP